MDRNGRNNGRSAGQSRSGFVYRERSVDSLKQRAERTGGKFDTIYKKGFSTWKPKVGENVIRYLPPTWDDAEHYGLTIWTHGYVGPDQGSYMCLTKMLGKPCPICKAAEEARRAGDEEETRQYSASERILAWILDRQGDDPYKPLLFNMSWSQDRDVASLCHNRRTNAPLWIDQHDVGYDVSFQRVGTTMKNTRYFGYQIDRDSSPIARDVRVMDQVLQFVQDNPLPTVLQYYPPEYLSKALLGTTHAVVDSGAGAELLAGTTPRIPRESYEEGVSYDPETGEVDDDYVPEEADEPDAKLFEELERRRTAERPQRAAMRAPAQSERRAQDPNAHMAETMPMTPPGERRTFLDRVEPSERQRMRPREPR